jgi:hypothetical protein
MTLVSGTAYFAFADDAPGTVANPDGAGTYDVTEYVDIFLNSLILINDQEVDGSHPSTSFAWYSASLTPAMITALQDDGKIGFKVQLLDTSSSYTNDVYLKIAKLTATSETNNVPDGGSTLAMLGLAFAGLLGLRRRFAR